VLTRTSIERGHVILLLAHVEHSELGFGLVPVKVTTVLHPIFEQDGRSKSKMSESLLSLR
jgi:hypothetical protein